MDHPRMDLDRHVDPLTAGDAGQPQRVVASQVDLADLQKQWREAREVRMDRGDERVAEISSGPHVVAPTSAREIARRERVGGDRIACGVPGGLEIEPAAEGHGQRRQGDSGVAQAKQCGDRQTASTGISD